MKFIYCLLAAAALMSGEAWAYCYPGSTHGACAGENPEESTCTIPKKNRLKNYGTLLGKCNEKCASIDLVYEDGNGDEVYRESLAETCAARDFELVLARRKEVKGIRQDFVRSGGLKGPDGKAARADLRVVDKCTAKLNSMASYLKRCRPFS